MRVAFWTIAISSVRVALISLATAAVFFALFVAAAIWAPQAQPAIHRTIVDAIASGELNRQMTLGPLASSPVHRSVNDCLHLVMIAAPKAGGALSAVGNRMAWDDNSSDPRVPPYPDCQTVLRILPEFGGGNLPFFAYDRYLLGMRVLGRVMLSVMSLETMQRALLGVTYALLGAIGIAALFAFHRARDAIEKERALGYLGIAAVLTLFYGVHFFDIALNFAPMDCVQLVFILLSMRWSLGGLSGTELALYAASYGTLIAIFEFLTGGIPMALALLPLLLALGHRGDKTDYATRLVTLWASFCIAVISAFALKKLYAIAFLGDTENFIATLLHRVYGDLAEKPGAQYSLTFFSYTYYRASFVLGWGSSKFATLLFSGALATIALLIWRRSQASPNLRLACGASFIALLLWYVVFLNHAILHALSMVRPMVVILIAAMILLLASVLRSRETPRSASRNIAYPPT